MVQTYQDAPETEAKSLSRPKFLARDEALRSCFSGTSFPTDPAPVAGQLCFRTDRNLLYQYVNSAWEQVRVPFSDPFKGALLLNGDCAIDQPNAGASVAAGSSNFARDGLRLNKSGAGSFSWQRQVNANLLTARNPVITCDRYTVTSPAGSPGAGDFYSAFMPVEGLRASRLQYGRASARKAWLCATARSSVAWTLSGALKNGASDRSFPWSVALAANTTQDIAIEVPGYTDGTWNVDNTVGLYVQLSLGLGSTFGGVANAWASANKLGVAGAGLMATNGATLDITAWELVIGDVAPGLYIPPDPVLELARCMREYEKSFAQGTQPAQNVGAASGETRFPCTLAGANVNRTTRVRFCVPKRASPAVTFFNPGNANAQVRDFSAGGDCSASGPATISDGGFDISCIANAASTQQNWLGVHWVADARL